MDATPVVVAQLPAGEEGSGDDGSFQDGFDDVDGKAIGGSPE